MLIIKTINKNISYDFDKDGIITNLDNIIEDGEASEISGVNILNYVPLFKVQQLVYDFTKKLGKGGFLALGGNNLDAICKKRSNGLENVVVTNQLLFGNGSSVYETKLSASTPAIIKECMKMYGLKIQTVLIEDVEFCVIGKRNE